MWDSFNTHWFNLNILLILFCFMFQFDSEHFVFIFFLFMFYESACFSLLVFLVNLWKRVICMLFNDRNKPNFMFILVQTLNWWSLTFLINNTLKLSTKIIIIIIIITYSPPLIHSITVGEHVLQFQFDKQHPKPLSMRLKQTKNKKDKVDLDIWN